jgi:hypothetical protein
MTSQNPTLPFGGREAGDIPGLEDAADAAAQTGTSPSCAARAAPLPA